VNAVGHVIDGKGQVMYVFPVKGGDKGLA